MAGPGRRALVAPDARLRLDQCGLPARMAFDLYFFHLAGELVQQGLARTPAAARRLIEAGPAVVRATLDALSAQHPVILRAGPCLSRHALQAFFPVLHDHDAVTLAPAAMARLAGDRPLRRVDVFLPLGDRAQQDACQRMTSPATLVAPESRRPRVALSADARAGLYLASLPRAASRGKAPLPGPAAAWIDLLPGATLSPDHPGLRRLARAQLAAYGALRGFYASLAEAEHALEQGALELGAHVFVRHRGAVLSTVAGRCLVLACLPGPIAPSFANTALDRRALDALFAAAVERLELPAAARLVEELDALGLRLITARAPSLGADDLRPPARKAAIVAEARAGVLAVAKSYEEGLITDGERYNKVIDLWSSAIDASGEARAAAVGSTRGIDPETGEPFVEPSRDLLTLLSAAGVAGDWHALRQLTGTKGFAAKPCGELHEVPLVGSLGEGLSPHEVFMSAMGGRAARVNRQRRDRDDARLAEVLVRALGRVRIVERDCGALGSLPTAALLEGLDTFVSLADRARGRVHAETGELIAAVAPDTSEIPLRSPVFCEARGGLCAACYGAFPGASLPHIGERVGLHAAHALISQMDRIGERHYRLPGGWSRAPFCSAAADGVLVLRPDRVEIADRGDLQVVLAERLELVILGPDGLEIPSGSLPHGATLRRAGGERVARGDLLGEWDAPARPRLALRAGVIRWVDLVPDRTCHERLDEVTGLSRLVVRDHEDPSLHPALHLHGDDGVVDVFPLAGGAHLLVGDGARVARADEILRERTPTSAFRDPLGYSDLARLIHARAERPAVLAELRGVARLERLPRHGIAAVVVTPLRGTPEEIAAGTRRYPAPDRWAECLVADEVVAPGDVLFGGDLDPRDLVRVLGPAAAARHLVDRLQLVTATFGATLDARHAEIIARALLSWVRILAPGDGPWPAGTLVRRAAFDRRARTLCEASRAPPVGQISVAGLARRGCGRR